ncbi:hypothetical protein IU451_29115 [Nocardia cyriacigeorgica]|uniref:hypothetical protein n=1 Tax=Nocardia cyriacigeorgica TaxID=135487 RepID=UPI001893C744|nr:hypothetical protein [Nocardia cyriacigeorgica]MBF6326565.1 hypothetical protein [Nocardia cyriacigeorgica]
MSDDKIQAWREKWWNSYTDAVRTGNTVSTFDEAEAWRHRSHQTYVYATGELAEQVRERLGCDAALPVRVHSCYDIGRKEPVMSFDCGIPGDWFKDVTFDAGGPTDVEHARAWVEGREPIIQADWPRRDEEKRAIRITLTEALTAAAESGSTNLWQAIEDGIFPERWAWWEAPVRPPAGMYEMWYRAVDIVLPIIDVDRDEFEDDYHLYHCWSLPPLDAWKDKPRRKVAAVLRRAIEVEQGQVAA